MDGKFAAWPALLGFVLLGGVPGDSLEFAPAPDTHLTKRFETRMTFELDEAEARFDGVPVPAPELVMEGEWSEVVAVHDTYHGIEDGRPVKLVRHFEELAYHFRGEQTVNMEGNRAELEGDGEFPLDGATVIFEWNEEEEGWDHSFAHDRGDADLLDGLSEDMDVRTLLSSADVAVGDSWEIDPMDFLVLLTPARGLTFSASMDAPPLFYQLVILGLHPMKIGTLRSVVGVEASGEVSATYIEVAEGGDDRIAVVELSFDLTLERDVTERAQLELSSDPSGQGIEFEVDAASLEFEFDGEARLLWNLDRGHVHSLTIDGDYVLAYAKEITATLPDGESIQAETKIEFSGVIEHRVALD